MLKGAALTDSVRNCLLRIACEMYLEKRGTKDIIHRDIRGEVRTDGVHVTMGAIYGMFFHADVWSGRKRSRVSYIVCTRHLEDESSVDMIMKDSFWLTRSRELEQVARWN